MGLIGDITGGLAGLFTDDGSGEASDYYKQLAQKYGGLNPQIVANTTSADAPTRGAQLDVLKNLQGIYGQGGLDAAGRATIADANMQAGREGTAAANAIGERARAAGYGGAGSGVTLALQQQAGQDAAERAAQAGYQAAAQGEANRNSALSAAGQLSTAAGTQQNAIDRFNATARQTAQQQTFGNQMAQLGGQGNAYGAGYAAKQQGYGNTVGAFGKLGAGGDDIMAYLSNQKKGGAGGGLSAADLADFGA